MSFSLSTSALSFTPSWVLHRLHMRVIHDLLQGYACGLYMTYSKAGWLLHREHHYRVCLHIKKTCGNLLHLSVKCNLFWVVFYWANIRNFPSTYKHTQLKVQNKSYFCVSLSSLLSSYPFHLGRMYISVKPFYHTEKEYLQLIHISDHTLAFFVTLRSVPRKAKGLSLFSKHQIIFPSNMGGM